MPNNSLKKLPFFLLYIFFVFDFLYALDTRVLPSKITDSGESLVNNLGYSVEDRIIIINNTDTNIKLAIIGQHKKNRTFKIAIDYVPAHSEKKIISNFDDRLSDFKSFTLSIVDGKILESKAICKNDDLYFEISKLNLESESQNTFSQAEELLKWKELLDENIITQDEFEAKKKQLLDL